jgi:sugar transferase (PEP-CTERM/EpsH1 system associated)
MTQHDSRALIAHVVHRFDVGGLENGVVNLINRLPAQRFRHAVIALTEVGDSARRVQRDDVQFFSLHKPAGQGLRVAPRMVRLLRELSPAVVHTRNLGALEMMLPAAWAGVPVRVHGEHGWDTNDPDGRSIKYRWVRRMYAPLVHRYVALSLPIVRYLRDAVGIGERRIEHICNGVDTQRFHPAAGARPAIAASPFTDGPLWLVGTVGRLQPIKNQMLLAQAFVRALAMAPAMRDRLRLVIAGDGPLREPLQALLSGAGIDHLAWLAGERNDVPELLRGLDAFVLPSHAEGISNTILEAMASGLPIVATDVGGARELLDHGVTGVVVPPGDVESMARALLDDALAPERARRRGQAARTAALQRFGLDTMVAAYGDLYEQQLARAGFSGSLQRA